MSPDGFATAWLIAGPFPNGIHKFGHDERCVGFFADLLIDSGGEEGIQPTEGQRNPSSVAHDGTAAWEPFFSDTGGLLDFTVPYGKSRAVAYAFCHLAAEATTPVTLLIGSDDGVKIWLNHTLVHQNHVGRGAVPDDDRVDVTLLPGANPCLVKVDQGDGDWGFYLRLLGTSGKPPDGVTVSVPTTEPLPGQIVGLRVTPTLFLKRSPEGLCQVVRVSIVTGGSKTPGKGTINGPGFQREYEIAPHPAGRCSFEWDYPAVENASEVHVSVSIGERKQTRIVTVEPVRNWEVFLVQHTHTDIGFSDIQTIVMPDHLRFLDRVLELCGETDGYPDDAKFRWTCESSWAVLEYLRSRPPEVAQEFARRCREGRIEVTGLFLNSTDLATEEALARSILPIRTLRREHGIPVTVAMQSDINGFPWILPSFLRSAGIKYFNTGINKTRSLLPFDRPTAFWWEAPDGQAVLSWRGDHYHIGNMLGFDRPDQRTAAKLEDRLRSLEREEGYPHSGFMLQFSGYWRDNAPPISRLSDYVRDWNQRYAYPHLRLANLSEWFRYLEENFGDQLERHRAAWPDWWSDGIASTARETQAARRCHQTIWEAEVLTAALCQAGGQGVSSPPIPIAEMDRVMESLLFFDEHTWGAHSSISNPDSRFSMDQWMMKSSFVWEAKRLAAVLRESAVRNVARQVRSEGDSLVVVNCLPWQRTGPVEALVPDDFLDAHPRFHIADVTTGEAIPHQDLGQHLEGRRILFVATDVPSCGYRTYLFSQGEVSHQHPANTGLRDNTFENEFYRLVFDATTGNVAEVFDKVADRSLVDPDSPHRFNEHIYERITSGGGRGDLWPGKKKPGDLFERTGVEKAILRQDEQGPIRWSVRVVAEAPYFQAVDAEYRLYSGLKRLDILDRVIKPATTDPEALYRAFPFALREGRILAEVVGGVMDPARDPLEGSCADWQAAQNWVGVFDEDCSVTLAVLDVPLIQAGGINTGKWNRRTAYEHPWIYSWVMNNYWFTNFKADQGGEFLWQYAMTTSASSSVWRSTRFGSEAASPLVSVVARENRDGPLPGGRASFCRVEPANVILTALRPSRTGGGVVVRLREVEGVSTIARLEFPLLGHPPSADMVTVLEEETEPARVSGDTIEVAVPAHGFVMLRVEGG